MDVLITALGSYGDVHPMVGLGATLRRRGNQVSVLANPYFGPLIQRAGLELIPLATREEYLRLAGQAELWDPRKGPKIVLREGGRWQRKIFEIVSERYRPSKTVVCAHTLDLGSRVAQDKLGVPVASVHLAPLAFRSINQTPKMYGMLTADWVPSWLKRFQFWVGDRFYIDPALAGPVNGLRRELGLPAVRRFYDHWWYSSELVLGMFPNWFAEPQPDWPRQTRLTGFPLWDESTLDDTPDEVTAFLDQGDPPLVFTPGSAMRFGQAFFSTAAEVCSLLSRRGLLLTRFAEQIPKTLPSGVRHFEFVPLSQLLPRAAALVHHGGIGSSAQGLAGGVPHLVMPMAFDQHDNAVRLQRLGVADVVRPKHFRAARVARSLEKLLASDQVAENCRRFAAQCDGQAALNRASDWIEELGKR